MMDLRIRKPKSPLPDSDYLVEDQKTFENLLYILTPKFVGKWDVVFLDPKVTYIKECAESQLIPDYINCHMYINKQKMSLIIPEFPQLAPKQVSVKEMLYELVSKLKHPIEDKAVKMLYQAIGNNEEVLEETLRQLDRECATEVITSKQVQGTVNYTKKTWASDVVNDFLLGNKWRYQKLQTLIHDLGDSYAYNAMYSYVKKLLKSKQKYLSNEDPDIWIVQKISAPQICYMYVLFANSTDYRTLFSIMQEYDKRSNEALERIAYVNLL